MKNKYLILKGCAGLGNRFITLMKAIQYARLSSRKIYVDWADGMFAEVGTNVFYKYFEIKNVGSEEDLRVILNFYDSGSTKYPLSLTKEDLIQPIYKERDVRGSFFVFSPKASACTIYKVALSLIPLHKLVYLLGLQSFQRIKNELDMNWFKAVKTMFDGNNFPLGSNLWPWLKEDIVIFADFRPLINMKKFTTYIQLKPFYQQRFECIAEKLGIKDAIGVHIRYTDKKPKQSLNKLIEHLKKKDCRDHKIFLASDNDDIVEEFRDVFGNRLILYSKFIPHVEDGGIHIWAAQNDNGELKEKMFEDSLTEMWLLSMTQKLYWQGNSSFSYISKVLKRNINCYNWMNI